MPVELAHAEAMLEGRGQGVVGVGEGAEALAQVAHGRHVQHRAQPPGRSPVVGHRDDAGDVGREALERAQRHGGAVAAADRDDPHRAMSRWKTACSRPRRRRTSSARATLRWRPPVQPIAIDEVGLALLGEGRDLPVEHARRRREEVLGLLLARARSRATGSSRPVRGRSSSIQCGLGRKRQSKTRSTSRGMP